MKIGQELVVENDFKIYEIVGDKVITIKKGDRGFLDSKGCLHLINGEGKGKIIKDKNIKLKGYDHENIALSIYHRLNSLYGLGMMLEENEIDEDEFIEEIEDVLSDML